MNQTIIDVASLCIRAGFTLRSVPVWDNKGDHRCLGVEVGSLGSNVYKFISDLLFYAQKNNLSTVGLAYALKDLDTTFISAQTIAYFPSIDFTEADKVNLLSMVKAG